MELLAGDTESYDAGGLTWDRARAVSRTSGPNTLTPPIDCPPWVCCLLPCLLSTESMRRFHASIAESACVLRDAEWTDLDASAVVPADVLKLREGDVAPADLRVLDCSDDFAVDSGMLTGDYAPARLAARDFVALSARCTAGEATLVVVAIGDHTELARRMCVLFVLFRTVSQARTHVAAQASQLVLEIMQIKQTLLNRGRSPRKERAKKLLCGGERFHEARWYVVLVVIRFVVAVFGLGREPGLLVSDVGGEFVANGGADDELRGVPDEKRQEVEAEVGAAGEDGLDERYAEGNGFLHAAEQAHDAPLGFVGEDDAERDPSEAHEGD